MSSPIQEIKDKINIADFIGSYIKLLPAGKNLKAVCPFHQEKTPSFVVSPERQIWHCFGCGNGGDIIKFLMQYENIEFYEAIQTLAEKAGIELSASSFREQKEFLVLYDLNDKAKQFFKAQLGENPAVLSYLKSRGLAEKTIEEFELGFSRGGETLTLHLINLGYGIGDIVKSGLSQRTEKGMHRDKFYERIMFPITSSQGKTIGFTGRLLPEKEKTTEAPKYLNTAETPIFSKSKVLYGWSAAKKEIANSKTVFLVEGQMDFLMSFQAGIKNCVAVSGTSLTGEHLKIIRRLADTLVLSFDKDEAGLKALERSLDLMSPFDFNVKVIELGRFKDPAEAAEREPSYLEKAIKEAIPAFSYLMNVYLRDGSQEPIEKKRNIRHILLKISALKSAVDQNYWVKELAEKINLDERALTIDLLALGRTGNRESTPENQIAYEEKPARIELIAKKLLILAFLKEEFLAELAEKKDFLPPAFREILDELRSNKKNESSQKTIDEISLRSSYEWRGQSEEELKKDFLELQNQLKKENLKSEAQRLKTEIKLAEQKQDAGALANSMQTLQNIMRQIHEI